MGAPDSGTDVDVSSSSLTFSTSDWKTEQTVTVKADEDADAVADAAVELTNTRRPAGTTDRVTATVTVRITESDDAWDWSLNPTELDEWPKVKRRGVELHGGAGDGAECAR